MQQEEKMRTKWKSSVWKRNRKSREKIVLIFLRFFYSVLWIRVSKRYINTQVPFIPLKSFFLFWLGIFFVWLFFGRHPPNSWLDAVNKREKQVERDICLVHGSLWLCYVCFSFSFFVFHLFFARFLYLSQPFYWNRSMCNAVHCIQCVPIRLCMRVSLSLGVYVVVFFFVFFWWFRWW